MALYERAKKILVSANYNNFTYFGCADSIWRRQYCCPIYLYAFLIKNGEFYEKREFKNYNVGYFYGFFSALLYFFLEVGNYYIPRHRVNWNILQYLEPVDRLVLDEVGSDIKCRYPENFAGYRFFPVFITHIFIIKTFHQGPTNVIY